ncbi:MAG: hypothetical protein ACTS4U_01415 [Candidatus Hodgkinia cicadicola]
MKFGWDFAHLKRINRSELRKRELTFARKRYNDWRKWLKQT